MSVLNVFRPSTWRTSVDQSPSYTPTRQERLNEAAADRGFAFDLLEQAEQALHEAQEQETIVAAETLTEATVTLTSSQAAAERLRQQAQDALVQGETRSRELEARAAEAQKRADADNALLATLARYVDDEPDTEVPA